MPVPPHITLPPADRVRSPRTGWTRTHWETVADRMLDALLPYATPGLAQYRLPGRGSWSGLVVDGLEGFARSFLLAACRIAGAGGEGVPELIERYAAGLAAGTDRASGESWPAITDRSQQMVEAASIAVALHETRPWLWDQMDSRVRQRVVDWFSGFVGARTWDNNWRLFQVVSEQFLASVGAPYRREDIERGLDRIEDWYVGDGWYTDGDGRHFDYYAGWALHLYPLLWSRMAAATGGAAGDGGGRTEVYRQRLAAYLTCYPHFFGADGAPVHQGRSLTYRFAALAPLWAGALTDCSPLPPGLTRRLGSGTLRHFLERGVPDERGLLPLGWYDTFLPSTQGYSGPASPYWASKGFLGLLLPAGHPVWTETERPLPVEEDDQRVALPAPGWLLHGTTHDGIVRLVNHGSDHQPPEGGGRDDPHYCAFAYSTATAPVTAPHARPRAADNHLALLTPDGASSRRVRIHPLDCGDGRAASWHEAELPGHRRTFRIETVSLLHGPWEVRVHRVQAPAGACVRETGYAVAHRRVPHTRTGPGWALARTEDGLTSALVALHGWDEDGAAVLQATHATAYGPHAAIPSLALARHPGGTSVHISLIALSRDAVDPRALREAVTAVVVEETGEGHPGDKDAGGGHGIEVRFTDGTVVRPVLPAGP
ncbi:DUF2264 domain-containing protein [Streptomyces albus subsp. chlorinus]|uniref:DUF2264 domain-containing protein n=1 Tax=Streptomyces albus TaxID=1888 RepID=UPI00156F95C9|nr:DUF2264 domain-containing protein [Streptomyces albus]NSC25359.1 DUF2264 domain-containing protein [Streptomyces albus subsp. chlorinus]